MQDVIAVSFVSTFAGLDTFVSMIPHSCLYAHYSLRTAHHEQMHLKEFLTKDVPINLIFAYIILPVVLYGCETWSLTLRKERKLRVFENMVLRRIFGPRRGEVMGEWRRLHKEELNDLYCSPNILRVIKWRRMRWAGHVARMG